MSLILAGSISLDSTFKSTIQGTGPNIQCILEIFKEKKMENKFSIFAFQQNCL